ncbi:hypothetical protein THRCLA_04371 [Thraustotheca clavata]|uniref:MIT domain-containing protein n=1 Tax=Thraustotheca clavata TaxID=74557 RepID=A0A1V9ZZG1_9STRA|nr:hypothetical protein THRCLA_04371 [Thraustotheca clavata]
MATDFSNRMAQGVAWTRGTRFGLTKWTQEPFELISVELSSLDVPVVAGQSPIGIVLRYQGTELLVNNVRTIPSDCNGKFLIEFTGRTLANVRKAAKYFTAAKSSSLRFYVATQAERDLILTCLGHGEVISHKPTANIPAPLSIDTTAQPTPAFAPLNTPPTQNTPPPMQNAPPPTQNIPAPPKSPIVPNAPNNSRAVKDMIDEGFSFLGRATQQEEKGDQTAALKAYQEALRLFSEVYPRLPPNKTKTLLEEKCQEIQNIITQLQSQVPPMDKPPATETNSSLSMSERLYQLQSFADTLQLDKARSEKSIDKTDLELRLAALKNEATRAPPLETLEARWNRLRGTSGPIDKPPTISALDMALEYDLDEETNQVIREALSSPPTTEEQQLNNLLFQRK